MDELSKRLRASRRTAQPERDLWPAIESRIRAPRSATWQRAAAAVLLFAAGAAAGAYAERTTTRAPVERSAERSPATPLEAAAAVQRAGSEYVAAVARLRETAGSTAAVQAQGYEAAMAALAITADELADAVGLADDDALVTITRGVHGVLSDRTTAIIAGDPANRGGDE